MTAQSAADLEPAPQPVQKTSLDTGCCIAGGGPAGMMLGFLLARSGVDVVVLEKHADFFRDFRGDTIHPSTLELMYELRLLDDFLRRPHQQFASLSAQIDQFEVPIADFSHLPTHFKFIALMPQWDFLSFIAENGRNYPNFQLKMQAKVSKLLEQHGRVTGVRATTPEGEIEVHARLTIGADGRHSTVRDQAGFKVIDRGAPIDVLWMRLSRMPDDPNRALGRFAAGRILITLNRSNYWQCAYVIPKDGFAEVRRNGLAAFREDVASVAPFLHDRVHELKTWDDIKLLTVAVDRLQTWSRPGLLCLGDAAHAMSPIGGVGINLAIQDAVAAANLLARPLLRGKVTERDLRAVQRRREFPVRVTQAFQVFAHKRFLGPALNHSGSIHRLPLPFWLLQRFSILRRIPARLVGLGVRPEHIRTPDVSAKSRR